MRRWNTAARGQHPDFLRLWAGQTISMFGSLVSLFALPLIAVVELGATPAQIALLAAAQAVPAMLLGPIAGIVADRRRRRPLMIGADLLRAGLLVAVPVLAALDRLSMTHLYGIVVLATAATTFFDVAYRAYLPTLVGRDDLVAANGKLSASAAAAEVGGFGLGGILVQALTAPGALAVDAVTFLASALALARIRTPEPKRLAPPASDGAPAGAGEVIAGARHLWREGRLRALLVSTALFELSRSAIGVVIMLFFVRELDLAAGLMGPLFALGGLSSLAGAVVAARLSARLGLGPALALALLLTAAGALLIPVAGGPLALIVAILAASQLIGDGAATVANIGQTTLVQALTPDRILGRVVAAVGVAERGAALFGLAVGALSGEVLGLRATLALAGCGMLLAALTLARSPVRTLREVPVGEPAGS